MAFDKALYRKRRAEGKRGQGDGPTTIHIQNPGPNREQRRRKSVDRNFTRRGYKNGMPLSASSAETIAARVKRKEAGERERIEKKRQDKLAGRI